MPYIDNPPRLRDLFLTQSGERTHPLPLEILARPFLQDREIDFVRLSPELPRPLNVQKITPWALIEKWRELLAFNLISFIWDAPVEFRSRLRIRAEEYLRYPFWDEFQLLSALRVINCHLLDLRTDSPTLYQLASGAVPLDNGGQWSWGEIPHTRYHAELGVLWCLLGNLTGCQQYISAASRLANWHLNTIAHDFRPFQGLFIQEEDAPLASLLTWNYLLFHLAARHAGRPDLEDVAQKQLELLALEPNPHQHNISELPAIIEHYIGRRGGAVEKQSFCLSSYILDPHTNLAGFRSPAFNVICSLYGGRTGMGAVLAGDVQVVSFGPQHLPLGDCRSFGIEGGYYSQKHTSPPSLSPQEGTFMLSRYARLASLPSLQSHDGVFRAGKHSEMWIKANLQYNHEKLRIEARFCGFKGLEDLAMSFFVKCKACDLEGSRIIHPKSFEKFRGNARGVKLVGSEGSLELTASSSVGEMQIIPLAGGDNFWGADFLIAFELSPGHYDYVWSIENSSLPCSLPLAKFS